MFCCVDVWLKNVTSSLMSSIVYPHKLFILSQLMFLTLKSTLSDDNLGISATLCISFLRQPKKPKNLMT